MRVAIQDLLNGPWALQLWLEFWRDTIAAGKLFGEKKVPRIALQWQPSDAFVEVPRFVQVRPRNHNDLPALGDIPILDYASPHKLIAFVDAHYTPIENLGFTPVSDLADPWHQGIVERLAAQTFAIQLLVSQHITNHTLGPVVQRALELTNRSN